MKAGDRVILKCEGSSVEAIVVLASSNGKSVVFSFDAILAGHIGMMPATMHDATEGETMVGSHPITVEPK